MTATEQFQLWCAPYSAVQAEWESAEPDVWVVYVRKGRIEGHFYLSGVQRQRIANSVELARAYVATLVNQCRRWARDGY